MKTMVICLLMGCRAELPPGFPLPAEEPGETGVRIEVREIWDPACLMAIRELGGIDDPDEFEHAALAWLGTQERYVASEIAADHGRELLGWWHEETDNTPYGVTVVSLGKRLPMHAIYSLAEGGAL